MMLVILFVEASLHVSALAEHMTVYTRDGALLIQCEHFVTKIRLSCYGSDDSSFMD